MANEADLFDDEEVKQLEEAVKVGGLEGITDEDRKSMLDLLGNPLSDTVTRGDSDEGSSRYNGNGDSNDSDYAGKDIPLKGNDSGGGDFRPVQRHPYLNNVYLYSDGNWYRIPWKSRERVNYFNESSNKRKRRCNAWNGHR